MFYYPVVIPTLNRVSHLKRCIETLAKNTGAEKTELYISVDFPPTDKYREGYEQVKELLNTMDLSAFKATHIFYQDKNLGAIENGSFLEEKVKEKYDAYIFSEDDNEFAPNFLEYINKGLELFRDNEKVVAVCAARSAEWQNDRKNVLFSKLYEAYGVGFWIDKRNREIGAGESIILPEKPYPVKAMRELYKKNRGLFCLYILSILATDTGLFWHDGKLYWCDTTHSLYMHFTDNVCVAPAVAKARTWGNDGTGVNMPLIKCDTASKITLDTDKEFYYENIEGLKFSEENYKIADEYIQYTKANVIKAIFCYAVLRLFGKNRKAAVDFLKTPRKIWKKLKRR